MTADRTDVFVYGTLTDPERAAAVLEEFAFVGHAVLHGFHRVDGRYPTLAPGGTVEGRLLRTAELERLDRYEGVDEGLYVRVPVPRRGPAGTSSSAPVALYVGDPDRLGAPAEWPGEGSFAERVRATIDSADVHVAVGPDTDRQD